MQALRNIIATFVVAAAATGCNYESSGAVADESLWSAVPADSSEQQLPEREGRLSDIAALEDHAASLQTRLDEATARLVSEPEPTPGSEPRLGQLSAELEDVKGELRALRGLVRDGDSFRWRFEQVEGQLADVETRLSALERPVEEAPET